MRIDRAVLFALMLVMGLASGTTFPSEVDAAPAAKSAKKERKKLEANRGAAKKASATLADLGDDAAPVDLPEAHKVGWKQQSAFLLGASTKLGALAADADELLAVSESTVEAMAAMNMQFLALQEATQMESRKFQTLSNASKARHDIAMDAIRNLKS